VVGAISKAFVLDVAQVEAENIIDRYKVIEINDISSAGFYHTDMSAVVRALEKEAQEANMADRKQFEFIPTPDPALSKVLESSHTRPVTNEELREQRISFAFGNALDSEKITKESVRLASNRLKLL
jgi:hypothetical protein